MFVLRMKYHFKLIFSHSYSLLEQRTANNTMRAEAQMFKSSLDELKKLNNTMLDEHTALQLAFSALEEKLRSVQVNVVFRKTQTNFKLLSKINENLAI